MTMRCRPDGSLRMSPASRRVFRWWENVDFGTSGSMIWHWATVCGPWTASCRTRSRRAGSLRAKRTAGSWTSATSGCGSSRVVVEAITVRLSWNYHWGGWVPTIRYNSNGKPIGADHGHIARHLTVTDQRGPRARPVGGVLDRRGDDGRPARRLQRAQPAVRGLPGRVRLLPDHA